LIAKWCALGMAAVEEYIQTKARIRDRVPQFRFMYKTAYAGFHHKVIAVLSKRCMEKHSEFLGFLQALELIGDNDFSGEYKLNIVRVTENRYLTFFYVAMMLAGEDPNGQCRLEIFKQFFAERVAGEVADRGYGTKCWSDDFLRTAFGIPTLLPALRIMRQAMIHLLLPLMALGHCDAVLEDPVKFVAAAEGWVNVLAEIVNDDEAVRHFTLHGLSDEQRKNIGEMACLAGPRREHDDDGPEKALKALKEMLAAELESLSEVLGEDEETEAQVGERETQVVVQGPDGGILAFSRSEATPAPASPVPALSAALEEEQSLLSMKVCIQAVLSVFHKHPALKDVTNGRVKVTSSEISEEERRGLVGVGRVHCRLVEASFAKMGKSRLLTRNKDVRSGLTLARVRAIPQTTELYPRLTLCKTAETVPQLVRRVRAEGTRRWAPSGAGGGTNVSAKKRRDANRVVLLQIHAGMAEKTRRRAAIQAALSKFLETINARRGDPAHRHHLQEVLKVDVTKKATSDATVNVPELCYFLWSTGGEDEEFTVHRASGHTPRKKTKAEFLGEALVRVADEGVVFEEDLMGGLTVQKLIATPRCQCDKCKDARVPDSDESDDDGEAGGRAAGGGGGGAGSPAPGTAGTAGGAAGSSGSPSAAGDGTAAAVQPAGAPGGVGGDADAEARATLKQQNRVSVAEAKKLIRAELRGPPHGVSDQLSGRIGWVRGAAEPVPGSCLSLMKEQSDEGAARAEGFLKQKTVPEHVDVLRALREVLQAKVAAARVIVDTAGEDAGGEGVSEAVAAVQRYMS